MMKLKEYLEPIDEYEKVEIKIGEDSAYNVIYAGKPNNYDGKDAIVKQVHFANSRGVIVIVCEEIKDGE